MTEEERMSILRRYIRDPLFDDTELYYNGIYGPADLPYKVHVACSVLSKWKKEKNELEKETTIEKRSFPAFPNHVPKSKRTTATIPNPVFKNQKILSSNESEEPKTNLRLTFKLAKTSVFSVKKSDNNKINPQNPQPKKRSRTKVEDDDIKATKRVKSEQLQRPVEPIIVNNSNISANLKARLQKNNAVLLIKKNLTRTDVHENNQRLSIPEKQIISPSFLTKEELKSLSYKDNEKVPHVLAKLIEPSGDECEIKLARWKMGKNIVFNLFGSWKKVVATNKFFEHMPVEVYSFREGPHLYFAVIRVQS